MADAVLLGLGSIIGTGLFVSVGIAAGIAGPAVLLSLAIAAFVAMFNGLSSAQLAASYAYSGGTYEYGHAYLGPRWGFTAGWVFLCAKSASAATAGLGFSGYVTAALGVESRALRIAVGLSTVALLTVLVAGGIRRSSRVNAILVVFVLSSLVLLVVAALPSALSGARDHLIPFLVEPLGSGAAGAFGAVLHASALMFVAYTGYARIATLGEEVREPSRTIPRAVLAALLVTLAVYVVVTAVAVASVGPGVLADAAIERAATLDPVARATGVPGLAEILAMAAAAAMLGVLLNLVLGLSRVLLAMGRRGEMPEFLSRLNVSGTTPTAAVLGTGIAIMTLVALGDLRTTWSFSAFTVLVYYSITNLAALRMPAKLRRYPAWIPCVGLGSCLLLAVWIDWPIVLAGLALIGVGLAWQATARRLVRSG